MRNEAQQAIMAQLGMVELSCLTPPRGLGDTKRVATKLEARVPSSAKSFFFTDYITQVDGFGPGPIHWAICHSHENCPKHAN